MCKAVVQSLSISVSNLLASLVIGHGYASDKHLSFLQVVAAMQNSERISYSCCIGPIIKDMAKMRTRVVVLDLDSSHSGRVVY